MMKPLYLSAALAMAIAAPAFARDQAATTDLPKPASDIMVHPQGAFGAKWGESPDAVAKKWEPTWNRLTPVPNRNVPMFDQIPVLSYIYTYGDFSYNLDAYSGPKTNGLSIVTMSSDSVTACDDLEKRLITQMGKGKVFTQPSKRGPNVFNRTRIWTDQAQPGNIYGYVFLPKKNSASSDFCTATILDANGGMY